MLNVESEGAVLRVTIDRPEVRNAFNDELIAQLSTVFTHVAPEVRAIVLTGSGDTFCAGGDLAWMRKAAGYTEEQNAEDALHLAQLFQSMVECHAVVIARVRGACFGGGCGLVAASDVAIASEDALFAFSEVRLGLVPATISPFVLPKIGAGHARHLFSTGEAFGAAHALRIGLVHDVAPPDDLDAAVAKRIKAVLAAGPAAVASAKQLAQEPPLSLPEAAALLARTRANEEAKEGISAFLEKTQSELSRMIEKLLIANRGEIAVRVIRAAREMRVRTVAVYSDADRDAMHVQLADEAVALGAPEPSASYLDAAKILDAARATGADAIHPGYGFLSERAEFSDACAKTGILFVGPPASAMRRLGAKTDAKALAVQAGVPIVPGMFEPGATDAQLKAAADQIGYPVMLKASAGGGGRGMRAVHNPADFDGELKTASDEALKAFGDGTMMVEKLVERPRHVEVQVLADRHGNVATLFERECSIQRRHQKLIEESPSPLFDSQPGLWPQMAEASRRLVLEAGYFNAGTVEFIVDEAAGAFYFLEVNARLQVEHPVTEMVTGLDLVQWQIRIAQGDRLEIDPRLIAGDRGAMKGHAIEARIVAEDPARNFLPSVGKILAWAEPKAPGVRVDTGYAADAEIPRYYDSMIAKVIAHGDTRAEAIQRLRGALLDFHVLGVRTNVAYLLDVLSHAGFQKGDIDTGFLGREFSEWAPGDIPAEIGAILLTVTPVAKAGAPSAVGAWALADRFRNAR
ncbi:enoyl-CoA hydratase-related protein [Fimbriimonas ginsengisoli]|uniref:biotin carboxylase n=1 Tax=Fimbriimonas ginsengisoli Gsoil 348 TaxID=661478 RepID=A0A068NYI9_FIMGI|nr:enoyl-CoA hydratase-related protein [Fimbriimonas ginsengisoli]AIE88185.1 acetyl-CoA carboxylase, biotin carboxylase [Fimbriimonas ginsengisoli Gsoil 348]